MNFLIPLYLYVLAVRKYGGGAEEGSLLYADLINRHVFSVSRSVDHYSTQPYYSLYAVNAVTGCVDRFS